MNANDNKETYDPFAAFPPRVTIHVTVIFPGEYKIGWSDDDYMIGWSDDDYIYVPGSGSYYPFREALEKALKAYTETQERKAAGENRDGTHIILDARINPINNLGAAAEATGDDRLE